MHEPPIAPKRVSRKSISQCWLGAYLTFFYKSNRPIIFQTISESERNSDSLDIISNLPELPGFTPRTSGVI